LSIVRTHSLAAESSPSFPFRGSPTGFASAASRIFIASGESAVSSAATAVSTPFRFCSFSAAASALSADFRS
jgi:hypothetical protein